MQRSPGRPIAALFTAVLLAVLAITMTRTASADEPIELEEFTNSLGMKFKRIPPGEFMMGSTETDPWAMKSETPRRVRITRPFFMAVQEVRRKDFEEFVRATGYKTAAEAGTASASLFNPELRLQRVKDGSASWRDPGFEQTEEHPVVLIAWSDAKSFCEWLSRKEGRRYRLPTEAEWEYAARAGERIIFPSGDDPTANIAPYANVADSSLLQALSEELREQNSTYETHAQFFSEDDGFACTAPVGRFLPNAWGLYDTTGNVYEICADLWHGKAFASSPLEDPDFSEIPNPILAESGHVVRGGGFCAAPLWARISDRAWTKDSESDYATGFRVAISIEDKEPFEKESSPSSSDAESTSSRDNTSESMEASGDKPMELEEYVNGLGMRFKRIPPGEFMMGSPEDEKWRESNEQLHPVRITRPFYMGVHEVRRTDFAAFLAASKYETDCSRLRFQAITKLWWGTKKPQVNGEKVPLGVRWPCWEKPEFSQNELHPVVFVSWNDAQAFCRWLSEKEGREYRLPTEAEWEYAARGGAKTAYPFGDDATSIERCANLYDASCPGANGQAPDGDGYAFTAPVGMYSANRFGLHDMIGNVSELCQDGFVHGTYFDSPFENPCISPETDDGVPRVVRGGDWMSIPSRARTAFRGIHGVAPDVSSRTIGFRVVISIEDEDAKTVTRESASRAIAANDVAE